MSYNITTEYVDPLVKDIALASIGDLGNVQVKKAIENIESENDLLFKRIRELQIKINQLQSDNERLYLVNDDLKARLKKYEIC